MKRIRKGPEPDLLRVFRSIFAEGSWDDFRAWSSDDHPRAYLETRRLTILEQGGLCAYCEIDISDNDPLKCRVEHFHEKSDRSTAHNWALDWRNMLAVCNGGSHAHVTSPEFSMPPLKENLSCDAHKSRMIEKGRLQQACEGWILNPLELVAIPSLFRLNKTNGHLMPDEDVCARITLPLNRHADTTLAVLHTIDMFNLNCARLATNRLKLFWELERRKKEQRSLGYLPHDAMRNILRRFWHRQWPGYFTVVRLALLPYSDEYLQLLDFAG